MKEKRQGQQETESVRNPYEDIIDLPHHVSKKHPQMPMENRAAQFAPFAALKGRTAVVFPVR